MGDTSRTLKTPFKEASVEARLQRLLEQKGVPARYGKSVGGKSSRILPPSGPSSPLSPISCRVEEEEEERLSRTHVLLSL